MTVIKKKQAYRFGIWAEYLAICYLLLTCHKIIAKRYKTPLGEIDIIAKKGNTLLFIEVKGRYNNDDNLHEAITPQQKKRIQQAASLFLMKHPHYQNNSCRFDAILISKKPLTFKHHHHIT